MSYLAFALKYRPKSFDEVVGQQHVVTSLKNAILKKRVHHAYLFSGPRGVGKTSLARILAKALNCIKGPTVTPCGECPACIDISRANSLDVIEIDGASNRGIDEIRTLRESVKLSPAHARFKIYIIDEVHMLTQEAFNALLKTLEEPPAHVKFIFATTHPQKVLPTILSRCQKFQFSLLPLEKIIEKLKAIVKSEKLKVKDNLLYAVGRAAGGSIRDAESLLDQIIPVVLEKGSIEDVFSFLGIIDEDTLNKVLKSIVEKDLSTILNTIESITQEGKDLGVFLSAMISHLRNLLLGKVSMKGFSELGEISPQSKDLILKLSASITVSQVLEIIELLIRAKELSARLNTVRIPLELSMVKFCYKEGNNPISQKVKDPKTNKQSRPSATLQNKTEKKLKQEPVIIEDDLDLEIEDFDLDESNPSTTKDKPDKEDSTKIKNSPKKSVNESLVNDNAMVAELKAKWREIISSIQKKRAALASHLLCGEPFCSAGNVISIAFSHKDKFHKEIAESAKNSKYIEGVISEFMGRDIGIRFILADDVASSSLDNAKEETEQTVKKEAPKADHADHENEFINDLLDTFKGKIHTDDE